MSKTTQHDGMNGIAIIGMAGRFPGARNIAELWQNLRNGVESVTFFSDEELVAAGVDAKIASHPDFVRAKAVLADADLFDAAFFGYAPREAMLTDPQHRVFLECAWEALENAGYSAQAQGVSVGVFAGNSINTYLLGNAGSELVKSLDGMELLITSDKDFLATRVSYKLNLKGPSITIQTACSTSLVAVCQACQSLLSYQCDIALAGGVSVKSPRISGYMYKPGAIASPDGHCRAFDARAQGIISGEGVCAVVLKRLEEAMTDGDEIHAVIKGFALNNDGSLKVGYTAPSVDGQAEVIAMAQAFAGVSADTISYIEAHGTGTELGDPIEVAALSQAFRASTKRVGFCAIGSVKTNFGHLDAAAGCAGLIKTVLALEHRELPPSLHFEKPNPEIDFANSPFYVVDRLTPWPAGPTPRRAGVSSFGIGGTNAHVVLEEAPATELSSASRPWQLVVLSAKTEGALDAAVGRLASHLEQHEEQVLADVAYTLQVGRHEFDWRAAVLCRDAEEAREVLSTRAPGRLQRGRVPGKERPVVFMFTGQGSQYPHMGEGLYRNEEVYRQVVDECCEILWQRAGLELKAALYPAAGEDEQAAERLRDTRFAQPALFVTEYALARLWMSWGIRPEAMIGHSVGEYVAACVAGVMSLEDALLLVATRGRLISGLERGAMLAVPLSESDVQPLLGEALSLAAVNSPRLCVVSGQTPAVGRLEGELRGRGLEPVRLHTSHAFHSRMMEPILPEFARCVSKLKLNAPQLPYVSNVSGTWIGSEQATDPQYWVSHLRQGVRFSAGIERLLQEEARVFLEVGPGSTLAGLVRQHLRPGGQNRVFSSMRSPRDDTEDQAYLLDALGKLWLAGVAVDWKAFSGAERRRRVRLPTYPFERRKYWLEPGKASGPVVQLAAPSKKSDVGDWLYVPSWKQTPSSTDIAGGTPSPLRWLLFADERGLADRLARRLSDTGDAVVMVRRARIFEQQDERTFCVDPSNAEHYESLFFALETGGGIPIRIVHLWAVTGDVDGDARILGEELLDRSFWSPACIAKALGRVAAAKRFEVTFVSDGMQEVTGDEKLCPEKATILGPCRVIPQEYPDIICRSIDVVLPEPGSQRERLVLDQLCAELRSAPADPLVAYRGIHRWVRTHEPVRVDAQGGRPSRLRDNGVYLITGGLGGIGLAIAGYLASSVHARLVLVGRSELPEADSWDLWLATHAGDDRTSKRIRSIRALEKLGAQVMVASADVANRDEMQRVVKEARERFGEIHGVIHSAGVPAGGIIELKTLAAASSILAPKVQGTMVLDDLFKDTELDFMVLCSSLTATLGGGGQVDYTAANAFLDAYARAKAGRDRRLTVSIEWDAWSESGMAAETEVPSGLLERRRKDLEAGIRDGEGVDVFCRVLECSLPQVMVSTRDLIRRIMLAASPAPSSSEAERLPEAQPASLGHARPSLSTDYVAQRNETEQAIAAVWEEFFGIERIGIHDNFLELGGHSLLAIQIASRIGKDFGLGLPVNVMFESPTIAEIAEHVERLRGDKAAEERALAEVLDMVEKLSDEEVNRLLAQKQAAG